MHVIPLPNNYEKLGYKISFSNYRIIINAKLDKCVREFNKELAKKLIVDETKPLYTFEFEINKECKEEEYRIYMQDEITLVEAKNKNGFYLATRTLSQLFSLQTKREVTSLSSDAYNIIDCPRFKFRSFAIDESRHFFGKEEIKRIINLMSLLKYNYFHWHLSDDQGFRIDFETFPNLKEIASCRKKTKINNDSNDDFDYTPYEHCYSYDDIKEIIDYAKQHFIEIIPEIDVPGHSSAIVSAYPFLHCQGKKIEVPGTFTGLVDNICPSKETSIDFTIKLFDELMTLFSHSTYIHIGGDEVNTTNWKTCPDCQKTMKDNGYSDFSKLLERFSNIIAEHIIKKGRKVIAYADSVFDNTNPDIILQYWDYKMLPDKIDYINKGRETIYSPCSQMYFNDPYAELPLQTTYNRGIHLEGLHSYKSILGMDGFIWTEWVLDNKMLEFNINPRLCALSESMWTRKANMNFNAFINNLKIFNKTLDYLNIIYAPLSIAIPKSALYKKEISSKYRLAEKDIEIRLAKRK